MAKSSLPYTSADKKTINDGWYALQRIVECDSITERRLTAVHKDEKKHFGDISGKAHIIDTVLKAYYDHRVVLNDSVHDRDELIMMKVIGVWMKHRSAERVTPERLEAMQKAADAWHACHKAYLATIR